MSDSKDAAIQKILERRAGLEQRVEDKKGIMADISASIGDILSSAVSGDVGLRKQAIRDNTELPPAMRIKMLADIEDVPAERTIGTSIGTGAGESALFGAGLGVLAMRVPAFNGAGRLRGALQNAVNTYGQMFKTNPLKTTTAEGFYGGVAGAGGFTLEKAFPDLPAAQFLGELAGGGIASTLPKYALKLTPTAIVTKTVSDFMSPEGATSRAARRMQALADPEEALRMLRSGEELSPKANLSVAQRTNQKDLVALENTIIEAAGKGELSQARSEALAQTNQALVDDLNFGGGVDRTQQVFDDQIQHYANLLDARVEIAGNRARRAANTVAPQNAKETLELAVRSELTSALREARAFENTLYEAIDQTTPANSAVSRAARAAWKAKIPKAQKDSMPNAAAFLNPKSKKFLGKNTTIFQLRGVQSALRAEARAARAGDTPDLFKASIADDIADSITEDIANIYMDADEANPVATAVAFSRELNQRFRQGSVGKVMGRVGTGADRIDPSMTLTATLGAGKTVNRVAYDNILTAVSGKPEVQSAMEDFLKHSFFRNQEFNAADAQNFLVSNADLLNRMPAFKKEIQEAIRTGETSRLIQKSPRGFSDPRINKAVIYIEQGPKKAFENALASRTTAKDFSTLIKMASRDDTGEALEGLKTSFAEFLLNKSRSTARDTNNVRFIDSGKLSDALTDRKTRIAVNALYSTAERARFDRVLRTAKMLDTARNAGKLDSISTDKLGMIGSLVARVTGAQLGRQVSNTIQGPAIFAQKFQELANAGVVNPAQRLLVDSIEDEDLFKALLETKLDAKGRVSTKTKKVINAWMGVTLKNLAMEDQEQPSQEQEE